MATRAEIAAAPGPSWAPSGDGRHDSAPGERWSTQIEGRRIIAALHSVWWELPSAGRFALLGVIASGLVALGLGVFITAETRGQLMVAEGRGIQTAVAAIEPALPPLQGRRSLTSAEIAVLDRLVDRALLDSDHIRAKLWSLDGVVLYSDAHGLIGQTYPEVGPRLAEARQAGVVSAVSGLDEPENVFEAGYPALVEFYVPVRDASGETVAVFEVYEDVRFLGEAMRGIETATWSAIGSGLGILLAFLVLLLTASMRSIERGRKEAEARARELAVVVGAADALASSLEPAEFFGRLQAEVRSALGLSRLAIEHGAPPARNGLAIRLVDGSHLVAERSGGGLGPQDERVLRSVANSLDAALANAALYSEVRDAAHERRSLLRRVVEAHEDERRRLVGELHDSLAGELIRVLYGLRGISARPELADGEIRSEIDRLDRLLGEAEGDLRSFMARIRPPALDHFGLSVALREAADGFARESTLEVDLRVRGPVDSLPADVQLALLRSTEEALLNVRKHARAAHVRVRLEAKHGSAVLSVEDDGIGWTADDTASPGRGLGLAYLRERIAAFDGQVATETGRLGGARLLVRVPAADVQ